MNCSAYEDLLEKWLSGEITPSEQELMLSHEASCPQCRALRESLSGPDDSISSLLGDIPDVPEDFHQKWTSAISQENRPRSFFSKHYRLIASAAVVLLVLGGTLLVHPFEMNRERTEIKSMASVPAERTEAAESSEYEYVYESEPQETEMYETLPAMGAVGASPSSVPVLQMGLTMSEPIESFSDTAEEDTSFSDRADLDDGSAAFSAVQEEKKAADLSGSQSLFPEDFFQETLEESSESASAVDGYAAPVCETSLPANHFEDHLAMVRELVRSWDPDFEETSGTDDTGRFVQFTLHMQDAPSDFSPEALQSIPGVIWSSDKGQLIVRISEKQLQ